MEVYETQRFWSKRGKNKHFFFSIAQWEIDGQFFTNCDHPIIDTVDHFNPGKSKQFAKQHIG
jgi:hypothetical protein